MKLKYTWWYIWSLGRKKVSRDYALERCEERMGKKPTRYALGSDVDPDFFKGTGLRKARNPEITLMREEIALQ